MRPQHLLDMTSEVLGEESEKLLESLVNFMNLIIFPGKMPQFVRPSFLGANLMALAKPDRGIRPIAMGMTIRRLAANCIMFDLNNFYVQEFQPSQLGVGTLKGAEAAVHALRLYLDNELSEDKVLLKIDFRNAFNAIRREPIISRELPNIYNYVFQSYSENSSLFLVIVSWNHPRGSSKGILLALFSLVWALMKLLNQ